VSLFISVKISEIFLSLNKYRYSKNNLPRNTPRFHLLQNIKALPCICSYHCYYLWNTILEELISCIGVGETERGWDSVHDNQDNTMQGHKIIPGQTL
jgi:hypothetical protein